MRRAFYLVLTIVTISLVTMALYTDSIARVVHGRFGLERTKTESFQYLEDEPHFGAITVTAQPVMYESMPTTVWFNFTLNIVSHTPVDLTVERVRIYLVPENTSAEEDPQLVGSMGSDLEGFLGVVNASTVTFDRYIRILPVILDGETNLFLDVVVDFELWNHSAIEDNYWSGSGGVLHILPVEVVPAYLQPDGWFLGMEAAFLIWGIVIINRIRVRLDDRIKVD